MGWSTSRSSAAGRRGLARAAILLVPLALTACGSVVAGSGNSAQTGAAGTDIKAPLTLCSDVGAVNHLVITRKDVILHVRALPRFPFPAIVTVTSAAEAQAVARALCALPPQPTGIINCPIDLGIVYQLRFAANGRHFPVIKVEATGCRVVTGVGKARTISRTPGFWAVLGKAMRLHGPVAERVFGGVTHCAPASTQLAQSGSCPGQRQPG
jgi:hypothetical protein